MLKNVEALLKSVGEIKLNKKNKDEVLLAISCYGKLLIKSSKKNVSLNLNFFILMKNRNLILKKDYK